jgi:hypothetical protein
MIRNFLLYIFSSILLITASKNAAAQSKIEIESENKKENHTLGLSPFYFIHHIFADAFFMTTLNKDVDTSDIEKVVHSVYHKLSTTHPVTVKIKRNEQPDGNLFFEVNDKDGIKILTMKTNFLQKSKTFTSDLNDGNRFVRMYFVKGKKLVYRKDVYSKEEEEKRRKMGQNDLAEFYLFNDRASDDNLVPGLLQPLLDSDSTSKLDKLYAKLYTTEYSLSIGDIKNADLQLNDLFEFYEKNKAEIPPAYALIVKLAGIEVYLNRRWNRN